MIGIVTIETRYDLKRPGKALAAAFAPILEDYRADFPAQLQHMPRAIHIVPE
ncbi:hypothetical protein [Sphingobium sp. KCTC 72723]|uniref:hypothetical protein n=1 Tax=Sphingobium sp. KCTC 72723 TaxID=2733867 RepID=UPI001CB6C64B|nr:hypothetical protein [Sphingobium sp. KCTC 72723]